ncbi:MAG: cache domain-containing protein [Proteobacteria bacterium]|nr:cache domain-containing protein [Pseudomonadota bacterium]
MTGPKSLIHIIRFSTTLLSLIIVTTFGYMWIREEIKTTKKQNEEIRTSYLEHSKQTIREQVEHAVSYIQHQQSLAETRLKRTVQARTESAWLTADYIYQKNRDSKSIPEIKKLIHDALYAASWDNGTGYYFVLDLDGTMPVNRSVPVQEGKNFFHLTDAQGNSTIKHILDVAQAPAHEGFCSYQWNKPENPEVLISKISYVKLFTPLNWVIGNGKYLDDEERTIQEEILTWIEKIHYGKNGYIFIGQWDGMTLSGPGVGENMLAVTDPNGVKIVESLIKEAKEGGGFVHYVMPRLAGQRPQPKISFAAGVAEWQWYVGTGLYVDEIEEIILQKQQESKNSLHKFILKSIGLLLLFVFFSFFFAWYLSKKIENNIKIFSDFFNKSATQALSISRQKIVFSEFQSLADSANQMAKERQQAWEELVESEKRFHHVVSAAHIPLAIIGKDNTVQFTNQKFTELFGYSLKEIPTVEAWWQLACPRPQFQKELAAKELRALRQREEAGQTIEAFPITIACKDGQERQMELSSTEVGQWRLVTFLDLTEQKKAAQEKQLLETKLHQAQKMEAIGLLAGGVAHDLNNILSAIVSYPDLLLMQLPEGSRLRQPLQSIQEAGKRAAEVVADLLTLARGIAATKEVKSLNVLIVEYFVSPEFQKLEREYPGIRYTRKLQPGLLSLICSPIHIKKVLMNLILNAAEACKDSGRIHVSTANRTLDEFQAECLGLQAGEHIILTVQDNGSGIAKENIEHIFEPFYTNKVMGKSGTGLGLAVVWNTIQDHNGAITVDSDGQETIFTLFFPATRQEPTQANDNLFEDLQGKGERILIIDDEPQQREICSGLLRSLGYKVKTAESGHQALALLSKQAMDLLILDMIMTPGMDGRETFSRIIELHPGQKAVIASGFSENKEVKDAQSMGAGPFIKKPYTLKQLAQAVKLALQ